MLESQAVRVVLSWTPETLERYPGKFVPKRIYAPHIVACSDPDKVHWSIRVIIGESINMQSSYAELSMLANNREATQFFSKLTVGSRFWLIEGRNTIAHGLVIAYSDINRFEESWAQLIC